MQCEMIRISRANLHKCMESENKSTDPFVVAKLELTRKFNKAVRQFNKSQTYSENKKLVNLVDECRTLVKQLKPRNHVEEAFTNMAEFEIKILVDSLNHNEAPILKTWLDVPVTLFSDGLSDNNAFTIVKQMFTDKLPSVELRWGIDQEDDIFITAFIDYKYWATILIYDVYECISPPYTRIVIYSVTGKTISANLTTDKSSWNSQLEHLAKLLKDWL
jgi:hypothetical protein